MKSSLRFSFKLLFVIVFAAFFAFSAHAQIFFDGSPGTGAPPATLGGFTMVPFDNDVNAVFTNVTSVPSPAPFSGDLTFSTPFSHRQIGNGWFTWSHGYTGSVYFSDGGSTVTLTLPPDTRAFYFYAMPNIFNTFNIEAIAQDGTTSGVIPVSGNSGATYFGFYTDGNLEISEIIINVNPGADGFAVGEFGIFQAPQPIPTLSQWSIFTLASLMLLFLTITVQYKQSSPRDIINMLWSHRVSISKYWLVFCLVYLLAFTPVFTLLGIASIWDFPFGMLLSLVAALWWQVVKSSVYRTSMISVH